MRRCFLPVLGVLMLATVWLASGGFAEDQLGQPVRPRYRMSLNLDYKLLTFTSEGTITVPVQNGDALSDAVFFIYANAPGVTGNDETHSNIVVDEVKLGEQRLEHSLKGAVLRVQLPAPQRSAFSLDLKWRGVVPRAPAGSGGLMEALGGMDMGGMFGGTAAPKKDPDYGVYSYGNGVLSLGSFWYPSLAVRQEGKWIDEAPSGVGDVGFSEAADYSVEVDAPRSVVVLATGSGGQLTFLAGLYRPGKPVNYSPADTSLWPLRAQNVRDFALLASDQFEVKKRQVEASGKQVDVYAVVTKAHAAKADQALEIAAQAIQIYSRKFGPYPYNEFKVVEGPMRGGAGGMEFSGMVSIASFLYDDMGKQLNDLAAGLGVAGLDKMLADLGLGEEGEAAPKAEAPAKAEEAEANPAQDLLGGMLGQQKAVFDSLLEVTIAHEVAHQWWAMGVGSDAQRAPWQDESLTNYSAMVYFEERYGKEKAQQMMDLHLKSSYSMGRMLGSQDARVDLATTQYVNSMQYGAVVYGKGALFYDALRNLVGDEVFFASLREYYARYNGHLAPRTALLDVMRAKAPGRQAEISNLYVRWIEGTHGDEDVAGGKVAGVEDLLGGLLGGMIPGGAEE